MAQQTLEDILKGSAQPPANVPPPTSTPPQGPSLESLLANPQKSNANVNTQPNKPSSFTDKIKDLWQKLNTGLISPDTFKTAFSMMQVPGDAIRSAMGMPSSPMLDEAQKTMIPISSDIASGLTSPASLAMGALTGGESMLAKAAPMVSKGLNVAGRIASVPYALEGGKQLFTGDTLGKKVLGAAEMFGGVEGMRLPVKENLPSVFNKAKVDTPPVETPPTTIAGELPAKGATTTGVNIPPRFVSSPELGMIDRTNPTGEPNINAPSSAPISMRLASKVPNDGMPKPPLDVAMQTEASDPNVPKSVRDVNPISTQVRSADNVLASRDVTAPIVQSGKQSFDAKLSWIANNERDLLAQFKDLTLDDQIKVSRTINGEQIPGLNPKLQERANNARPILDKMIADAKAKAPDPIGYLDNYLPHMEQNDINSGIGSILNYHFSKQNPFAKLFIENPSIEGETGSGTLYQRGLGDPSSPFTKTRTGAMTDIELDPTKWVPAYTESMAKVAFDKPWADSAKKVIAQLTDGSNLKSLAEWYVRNRTGYNSAKGLNDAFNNFTQYAGKTTARSLLGFNTGLQMLHLARIPANLYPELGAKYMAQGFGELASKPTSAWQELARAGLLSTEIRPWKFASAGDKIDSVLNFGNYIDALDKGIGYYGFKKQLMDQGMPEEQASLGAITKTKDATLATDPMRASMALANKEGGLQSTITRLGTQFKQVPIKIIEQYAGIAANAKNNPQAAARLLAGSSLALAGMSGGLKTFHVNPSNLASMTGAQYGAFGEMMGGIYKKLAAGDVAGALQDTALWLAPGGQSIKKQMESGPSAFLAQ